MTNRNGISGTEEQAMGSHFDQKLDQIQEKAKDLVEQGAEKVEEIKHRVVETKERVMAKGNAFLERLTEMIKAHPLRAVAIAFGAGYVGMRLFRRR